MKRVSSRDAAALTSANAQATPVVSIETPAEKDLQTQLQEALATIEELKRKVQERETRMDQYQAENEDLQRQIKALRSTGPKKVAKKSRKNEEEDGEDE